MATVELKNEFGLIFVVVIGTMFVYQWMGFEVVRARKKYHVPYPALYADEDKNKNGKAFNCVQRGHQNALEQLPTFLAFLILAGLVYPVTASVAGVVFLFGRILYFIGYASGDPNKRYNGWPQYIGLLTLLGCNGLAAYKLLTSK